MTTSIERLHATLAQIDELHAWVDANAAAIAGHSPSLHAHGLGTAPTISMWANDSDELATLTRLLEASGAVTSSADAHYCTATVRLPAGSAIEAIASRHALRLVDAA